MYALLTCTGMCTHVCVHACGGPRFAPYHSLYFEFLPEPGVHWLSRVAGQLTLRDPSVSVPPLGLSDTVQLSEAVPNHRCSPKSQMPYPSSAFTSVLGIRSQLAQHTLTHGATLLATQPYYCFLICHTKEINRQVSRSEFLLNILWFHHEETSGIHVLFP